MVKNITYFQSALKSELDLTQKYITSFSQSNDRLANKAIRHIVGNKGKMLRPILLILSGKYSYLSCNRDAKLENQFLDDIAKASAIMELIQMSSLIHDDVLDQSNERRKKPTLNKLKGNRFAILLGDYLVAQSLKNCYELIYNSDRFDSVILYSFLESITKLVLGEVQQNNLNNNKNKNKNEIDSYFEIVENKTASLFSLACFVGSTIGNKNFEHTSLLNEFGHHVGIAYQIIDDLRDFAITKETCGEKNFQDLIFGVKTLPIIYATNSSLNGEQLKLTNSFNSGKELSLSDKHEILDILINSNSIQNSLGEAKTHIVKARIILGQLQKNKYSILLTEFVNYLSEICDNVVSDIMSVKSN
jgi:octaprenyl-diphosphate synthase